MSLKDNKIPNEVSYLKLRDFPDGERIKIVSCGINEEAKFGPMAFFITDDGERITLPSRYVDYVFDIIHTPEDMEELRKGIYIIKNSRPTQAGGITPTFEIE